MNKEKKLQASLPKGFKDRWGEELNIKNKLVDTIKDVFINYSFEQLETPEFEKSESLGSFLAEDESNPMSDVFSFVNKKESLTLRYDLSAPLLVFVQRILEIWYFLIKDLLVVMSSGKKKQIQQGIVPSCSLMQI